MKYLIILLVTTFLVTSCGKTEEAIIKTVTVATVSTGSITNSDRIEGIVQ